MQQKDPTKIHFDLKALKYEAEVGNRYEKRLSHLVANGQEVERIKGVVASAIANIKTGQRSFVIYGESQSGKTEMMIALTAKLLDEGHKIVIVLLNDSVQLLGQNLRAVSALRSFTFAQKIQRDTDAGSRDWRPAMGNFL